MGFASVINVNNVLSLICASTNFSHSIVLQLYAFEMTCNHECQFLFGLSHGKQQGHYCENS